MDIISRHIISQLDEYCSKSDDSFDEIYSEIRNLNKTTHKSLLYYLNNIINHSLSNNPSEISCIHLHFENNLNDDERLMIAEFIILKHFFISLHNDSTENSNQSNNDQISILETKLNHLNNTCPEGASGKKGNRIYKNWKKERKETKEKISFLKNVLITESCKPTSIINVKRKAFDKLIDLFNTKMYCIESNKLETSSGYVVLNDLDLNSLKSIKVDDVHLLKLISNLSLFDCESSVKKFADFNFNFLSNLNKNHKTNFRSIHVFTFCKNETNSNTVRNKIEQIRKRYKLPINSSYSITSHESDHLVNLQPARNPKINLWGDQISTFWDTFLLETSIREFYELKSICMLNLYSLSFNEEIMQYIIDDIFSENKPSKFLSSETKQTILESSHEVIKTLRESLSQTMEYIIHCGWKEKIINYANNKTFIIVPEHLKKDHVLENLIMNALELSSSKRIVTWNTIDFKTEIPVLILAYQDQGQYPYYFYPNILESEFINSNNVSGIFISTFFGLKHDWALYNLQKDNHKTLNHPIRKKHFKWDLLESEIKSLRPSRRDFTIWDLENDYSNSDCRSIIRIKYSGIKRKYAYSTSDLFIAKFDGAPELRVKRISDLSDFDFDDASLAIQHLDVIQNAINIYEKFIDFNKQEEELKVIRNQFNIDDMDAGRLWKLLLKDIAQTKGEQVLYDELQEYLYVKELKIVSFNHFKNSWINPDSLSLTPLQKKVFIALCEFLDIPKSYFIIMQRIKNASKQASRQSTRQMNYLLMDLFNDECFDDISKAHEIIELKLKKYKKNHPLDEIGIDENYLHENLVSLVQLIHPEIKLLEVENIELVTQ